MSRKAALLWVDLEMTGLSPARDRILEVSAIATDWKLEEVARYSAVVRVDDGLARERMKGEFWEKNAKTREDLLRQNIEDGRAAQVIEDELVSFVKKNCKKVVYLAGSSIHQDQKFIEREWPKLDALLHYRMLDVSAWKIWFENVKGVKTRKAEGHRAEADVEESIMQFRKYLEYLK